MENIISNKPCLVQTSQGFSVSYKNKFLYSKYNPEKTIIKTIQDTDIQEETIIFCFSPVLHYGLDLLLSKLPKKCLVIGIELDTTLYSFTLENNNFIQNNKYKNFFYINQKQALQLPYLLSEKNYLFNTDYLYKPYEYRRIINFQFSAGVQFFQSQYEDLHNICTQSIMTYWSNRITLVKFGRKYSSNFFKNLKNTIFSTPIETYFNSITKPIVLFGAGESVDDGIKLIKNEKDKYFILCVDTSLKTLIDYNIIPDGCFIEEAQQIITKAFIGTQNKTHIFAAITSIPQIASYYSKNNISYFTTKFTSSNFISNLEKDKLLPNINPPFGSVGLTAFYYAAHFRKDSTIPIYFYGLDFSYSTGKTHCKNSLAHYQRLISNNRLIKIENYSSAFNNYAFPQENQNSSKIIKNWTTPILKKYADLFVNQFKTLDTNHFYDNIFNASDFGLELTFPHMTPENKNTKQLNIHKSNDYYKQGPTDSFINKIKLYFKNETTTLENLKSLLTEKTNLPTLELENKIREIVENREYLFLHFPDGHHFSYSQDFLNRLRIELEYFIRLFKSLI